MITPTAHNNHFSRYTFILCAAIMCYASFFFYPRWKNGGSEATISWDVSGYYWYLPSLFIYQDIKHQSFKDEVLKKYIPTNNPTDFQQAIKLDNGDYVMKYAGGMAVMYLPFFTAAHLLAGPLGYPKDGFSPPYQFAIQFAGLLVSLMGLLYLRKLLLLFYEDKVVAIVLIILVAGTNFLNYGAIDCGMSHCWLFTLYVFLLLNTHYFYQSFRLKYALRIGLLVGLAALTRPSDLLSVLIPLLWGLDRISLKAIKDRIILYLKNSQALMLAGVAGALVVSIQLIYWKYATGHWLYYSYEQNQHLYFRSPNFFNYTFSYRSGWLTYTPIMILSFAGLIPFAIKGRNRVAIIAFFVLNYYVVCSWNIWWYGGRAMVQSYPVLMFPMAALVEACLNRKILLALLTPLALVFIYFNIWVTYFFHKGTLYDPEVMTEAYFLRAAGRWNVPDYVALLKENPELYEGKPEHKQLLYRNNFEADTSSRIVVNEQYGGKSIELTYQHQNSPVYKFPFNAPAADWLKVTATFRCIGKEGNVWNMAQFVVRLMNKGSIVKENMVRVHRMLHDWDRKEVPLYMKLPETAYDSVNILFWNGNSDKTIWIDHIEASAFNEH